MDIRTNTQSESENKVSHVSRTLPEYKATKHITTTPSLLPQFVTAKLQQWSQQYGIPFDLSTIDLSQDNTERVKQLNKIVETIEVNTALLPEILKLIKRLSKSEIKLAHYYRGVTKLAISHQKKMDKYSADIFLQMTGYSSKSATREFRTNERAKIIDKREEKKREYYSNKVYSSEVEIIDAEIDVMASNQQLLTASKQESFKTISDARTERKKRIQEKVAEALQ